mmetsp:Transcript_45018/g.48709  ORF Transcript_45018/g.48709 Transcript_45018/m.48709 type:complete len:212 (-) Transcript_45018:122-757(-)
MDQPIGGLLRLYSQPFNPRRQFQKVQDVVGRDAHVVLEAGEEIILPQLISHHVPMLPTEAVRCHVQTLSLLGLGSSALAVVVGHGILPHLQPHAVGQDVLNQLSSFRYQLFVSTEQIQIDVPSPFHHGHDTILNDRDDHILQPIGTARGSSRSLVVFRKSGDDVQYSEGLLLLFRGGGRRAVGVRCLLCLPQCLADRTDPVVVCCPFVCFR